jgi:hypothetical protein
VIQIRPLFHDHSSVAVYRMSLAHIVRLAIEADEAALACVEML